MNSENRDENGSISTAKGSRTPSEDSGGWGDRDGRGASNGRAMSPSNGPSRSPSGAAAAGGSSRSLTPAARSSKTAAAAASDDEAAAASPSSLSRKSSHESTNHISSNHATPAANHISNHHDSAYFNHQSPSNHQSPAGGERMSPVITNHNHSIRMSPGSSRKDSTADRSPIYTHRSPQSAAEMSPISVQMSPGAARKSPAAAGPHSPAAARKSPIAALISPSLRSPADARPPSSPQAPLYRSAGDFFLPPSSFSVIGGASSTNTKSLAAFSVGDFSRIGTSDIDTTSRSSHGELFKPKDTPALLPFSSEYKTPSSYTTPSPGVETLGSYLFSCIAGGGKGRGGGAPSSSQSSSGSFERNYNSSSGGIFSSSLSKTSGAEILGSGSGGGVVYNGKLHTGRSSECKYSGYSESRSAVKSEPAGGSSSRFPSIASLVSHGGGIGEGARGEASDDTRVNSSQSSSSQPQVPSCLPMNLKVTSSRSDSPRSLYISHAPQFELRQSNHNSSQYEDRSVPSPNSSDRTLSNIKQHPSPYQNDRSYPSPQLYSDRPPPSPQNSEKSYHYKSDRFYSSNQQLNDRPVPSPQLLNDRPHPSPQPINDRPVPSPQLLNDRPHPSPQLLNDRPHPSPQQHHDRSHPSAMDTDGSTNEKSYQQNDRSYQQQSRGRQQQQQQQQQQQRSSPSVGSGRSSSERSVGAESMEVGPAEQQQQTAATISKRLREVFDAADGTTSTAIVLQETTRSLAVFYGSLSNTDKALFMRTLSSQYGTDHVAVEQLAGRMPAALARLGRVEMQMCRLEERLRTALIPRYHHLFIQFSRLDGGIAFLVNFRADLITLLRSPGIDQDSASLQAMNSTLHNLLALWLSPGSLQLERITWKSSCDLLQKISAYEAVQPIRNWSDLRKRVGPYRRCFAFTHPCLPREPVIVVHVALAPNISRSIQTFASDKPMVGGVFSESDTLDDSGREDVSAIRAAIFYSITSTQKGLQGVELCNNLIKRIIQELSQELPLLSEYSSLSPIPGFRDWLLDELGNYSRIKKMGEQPPHELLTESEVSDISLAFNCKESSVYDLLRDVLRGEAWVDQPHLTQILLGPLMRLCARYLYLEKRRGYAINPVANFHLRNGAVLWRLNWMSDTSSRGLSGSCSIMANYRYYPEQTDENMRNYVYRQVIPTTEQIKGLVSSDATTAGRKDR